MTSLSMDLKGGWINGWLKSSCHYRLGFVPTGAFFSLSLSPPGLWWTDLQPPTPTHSFTSTRLSSAGSFQPVWPSCLPEWHHFLELEAWTERWIWCRTGCRHGEFFSSSFFSKDIFCFIHSLELLPGSFAATGQKWMARLGHPGSGSGCDRLVFYVIQRRRRREER